MSIMHVKLVLMYRYMYVYSAHSLLATLPRTEVLLCPSSVEVHPQLARAVVSDAWVLLVVESVQSTAHRIVELGSSTVQT